MLYRIFTEDINHDKIESIAGKYFEGFTIIKSQGYWRLQPENSLILEIVTADNDTVINAIANEIKTANNQEAVLVQKIQNNQWFI